ncbi:MAG: ECF transporter S component [Bacillota bacterium]
MVDSQWSLYSLLIAVAGIGSFYLWYERRGSSPREMALIATLAALAGLSRLPFAAVPGLQPTTFLVLICGYVFGAAPGFLVGSMAAFTSNLFLGQGPWTPWQMIAWGLAGVCGGLIGLRKEKMNGKGKEMVSRWLLVSLAFLWGFIFGAILNFWHWLTFIYPLTLHSYLATLLISIWFDAVHAVGNALFVLFVGGELIKLLTRFKRRLTVSGLPVERLNGEVVHHEKNG